MQIDIGKLPTITISTGETFSGTDKLFNVHKNAMFNQLIKDDRPICMCFVGNSYSRRMADQMCKILKGFGIRNAKVTSLYKGSCSIQAHAEEFYDTALEQSTQNCTFIMVDGVITRYVHGVDAPYDTLTTRTRDEFFTQFGTDYDIVNFHQMSGLSHDYSSYMPYLSDLISYIKPNVRDDVIFTGWAPWSYPSQDCKPGSPTETFQDSCDEAELNMDISIRGLGVAPYEPVLICPMAIAVQNLKTSYYGEHFNDDYLHLTLLGDAFASLAYLCGTFDLNPYMCDLSYLYDDGTHDPVGYFNPSATVNGYPIHNKIERVFQASVYDALYRKYKLTKSYYASNTSAACNRLPEGKRNKYYYNNHDQYNVAKDTWSSAISTSDKYVLFENDTILNKETLDGTTAVFPNSWVVELVEWNSNDIDKTSSTQWYIKARRTTLTSGSTISIADTTTGCAIQVHHTDNISFTDEMYESLWNTDTGLKMIEAQT